jgi:hypothetical protein
MTGITEEAKARDLGGKIAFGFRATTATFCNTDKAEQFASWLHGRGNVEYGINGVHVEYARVEPNRTPHNHQR